MDWFIERVAFTSFTLSAKSSPSNFLGCLTNGFIVFWQSIFQSFLSFRRITKPKKPPITDHRPTDRFSSDPPTTHYQYLNHQKVLDWPTNHRTLTHRPPTHRLTDPLTTDSPTQLINNLLTHQTYLNRVTAGLTLSLIYFNSSFGLGAICY